jgi:hypothetical protein
MLWDLGTDSLIPMIIRSQAPHLPPVGCIIIFQRGSCMGNFLSSVGHLDLMDVLIAMQSCQPS